MTSGKRRKPSRRITRTLADNIRRQRGALGLSQEELADLCGLHRTYVGSVERGERNVTLSSLEAIAGALHTTVIELLTAEATERNDAAKYVNRIQCSGLTIYDPVEVGDPNLWIPAPELEVILNDSLGGLPIGGMPLRTHSKYVKELVCRALGYPVPRRFQKTQPRFPGQRLDTYVQKSNNVQVWNEALEATRRYVLIGVNESDKVSRIRVVTGDSLSQLDTTGTLSRKYQARCLVSGESAAELFTRYDTENLAPVLGEDVPATVWPTPQSHPNQPELLSIAVLYDRLRKLVGEQFPDPGHDQERARGEVLHRLVCKSLGYASFGDPGQFPDVRHQLLEVKLQTSPTIDLGLVLPSSEEPIDVPALTGRQVRHCDVRFAVFYASTDGRMVRISHLVLCTGEKFFSRFPQFGGQRLNQKLQIRLPADFFAN